MSGIRAIYRLLPELSSNPREIHFDKKITFISQAANWNHSHSLLKSCKNKYYLFLREVSLLLKRCFSVFCFNCVNYLLNKSSKNIWETSSSKRFSFHSFNRSCLLLELKRLMFANRLPTCYLHKLYLHVIPKSHTKQIDGIFAWHQASILKKMIDISLPRILYLGAVSLIFAREDCQFQYAFPLNWISSSQAISAFYPVWTGFVFQ